MHLIWSLALLCDAHHSLLLCCGESDKINRYNNLLKWFFFHDAVGLIIYFFFVAILILNISHPKFSALISFSKNLVKCLLPKGSARSSDKENPHCLTRLGAT